MSLNVLIAESHDVIRAGLHAIFSEDPRVTQVIEALNEEHTRNQFAKAKFDLAVINQNLVVDVSAIPMKNYIMLAEEPDIAMLRTVYRHGASGYLSINASADLLKTILRPEEKAFLIEPTLAPLIMDHILDSKHSPIPDELLTPREKEIVRLLRAGLDRPSIARQLCIAETTLKTHIKNITKKRNTDVSVRSPSLRRAAF